MTSVLWTIGAVAFCILLLWIAHRIEPHWVSKDGTRFLTTCVPVDRLGTVIGRRREIRGRFSDDGGLILTQRTFVRTTHTTWYVEAKSPKPPAGKAIYLLRPDQPTEDGSKFLLRMPAKSELVGMLDRITPGIAADADADAGGS